jgi:hypothetical protein
VVFSTVEVFWELIKKLNRVFEDMKTLCRKFFLSELKEIIAKYSSPAMGAQQDPNAELEDQEEEIDEEEEEDIEGHRDNE